MQRIFVLMVLFVLMTGCVKVVEPEQLEVPPAPPVKKVTVKETVVDSGVEEKVEPKQEVQLSPALVALQKRADEKVKSYSFIYKPAHETLSQDRWHVKGNKAKVELFGEKFFIAESHYDTIYIDAEAKTAFGFCESEDESRCPIRNKKFVLNYDDVMIQTPYQIVKSIPYGEIVGSELMWDRGYQVAEYVKKGLTYKIWIDGFSGLTAKQEVYAGDEMIGRQEFRHLEINTVDDLEVEPPKF